MTPTNEQPLQSLLSDPHGTAKATAGVNPDHRTSLTEYFLTHKPTIAELRRLNRETLVPWTLEVLESLRRAGVDLDKDKDAVVLMKPVITDELVDMKLFIRRRKPEPSTESGDEQ